MACHIVKMQKIINVINNLRNCQTRNLEFDRTILALVQKFIFPLMQIQRKHFESAITLLRVYPKKGWCILDTV